MITFLSQLSFERFPLSGDYQLYVGCSDDAASQVKSLGRVLSGLNKHSQERSLSLNFYIV